jgi:hypothetical protein
MHPTGELSANLVTLTETQEKDNDRSKGSHWSIRSFGLNIWALVTHKLGFYG